METSRHPGLDPFGLFQLIVLSIFWKWLSQRERIRHALALKSVSLLVVINETIAVPGVLFQTCGLTVLLRSKMLSASIISH
jgi:hypothetical protein